MGKKPKEITFHFTHNKRVDFLSDKQLIEEKNDAEFYLRICRKVKQTLTPIERFRVRGINRELKKRNLK